MLAKPRSTAAGFLGEVPYGVGILMQERVRDGVRAGANYEHLLLLEHPSVITLGRTADVSDILGSEQWLQDRAVQVVETDRGGKITYHGPGQLVGYPIIDLKPDRRDVRKYVRDLQQVLVRTLADFGVEALARHEQEVIGVWVGSRKIASIGVHLSRWITSHGFALNVSTDLSFFDAIVPCGLDQVRMTSIEVVTGRAPELSQVAEVCCGHFGEVFEREIVPLSETFADSIGIG